MDGDLGALELWERVLRWIPLLGLEMEAVVVEVEESVLGTEETGAAWAVWLTVLGLLRNSVSTGGYEVNSIS
jgi:hypothetical protein